MAEGGAGVGGLTLGVAAFVIFAVEGRGESGDLVLQREGGKVGLGELGFDGDVIFCWTSPSSRLRARGPCSRGLPPVTVTLWNVSPVGERKKACGCCAARERAVSLSGVTKPLRSLGRIDSRELPKPLRTRDVVAGVGWRRCLREVHCGVHLSRR